MRRLAIIVLACLLPVTLWADDRLVRLHAPPELIDTGLLKHILPRFSLKTQVRVEIVADPDQAQVVLGPDGRAVFQGDGTVWHLNVQKAHPGTQRFEDWIGSDVGQRTIFGFAPDGVALFEAPAVKEQVVVAVTMDGDALWGRDVAQAKCGRCHTVDKERGFTGIGSTPSFSVLRSLQDWETRFASFYVLNPHGAFTQIADVTEPFPIDRPSPIAPIELTLDEVEAMLAFVAAMDAADLGAPLQHQ